MIRQKDWLTTNAGVSMPPIIYGTAWKKERTADLVVAAVNAGFRGIDTAGQPKHYNEVLVGEALQRLKAQGIERDSLYLQTKFTSVEGQDPDTIPYDPEAPLERQISQSFAASLSNLGTDSVDTLILHSPLASWELTLKAWAAMEEIERKGGARQLGISNCYSLELLAALHEAATVKPAIVQNRFYQQTGWDDELRGWCGEENVIYQSFWTLTANPHMLAGGDVASIAGKRQKTPAQIFFRSLTQSGIVPLTGTTSAQHMKEDLEIFDFVLSPEELRQVGRQLQRI